MFEYRNLKEENVQAGSNKALGVVFGIVFLLIALWPLLWRDELRIWSAVISAGFFFLAFVIPSTLTPLNKVWTKFGLLLQKLVTPLVMGIVFFGVVTPTGLLMRLVGKRTLDLKYSDTSSYWIKREPSGPEPESFKNQF